MSRRWAAPCGGWSATIHLAVDGTLRPWALHLTGGHAADSPQCTSHPAGHPRAPVRPRPATQPP